MLQTFQVPSHLGAAAPAADGGYVLAAGSGFLHIDDAGAVRELAQPEAGGTDVRMNDGACDRRAGSGPEPWPALGLLMIYAWSAGRAARVQGRQLLVITSIAAALGLLIIVLKDVVLIHLH